MNINFFLWFQIKMIKRWPFTNIIIALSIIILSFFIKDAYMLYMVTVFLAVQTTITTCISCFWDIKNEIIFTLPFTPKTFIKKQALAIWAESTAILVLEAVLSGNIFEIKFLYNVFFLINISFLSYLIGLAILSIMTIIHKKYFNFITLIIMLTVHLTITFLKSFIFIIDTVVAIMIVEIILFIVSNVALKSVKFEKFIIGDLKK